MAGAGKTTTILEASQRMRGGTAILAYNKKIAEEIKGKLAAAGVDFRKVEAGTVHSFGFRAYRKAFPDTRLKERKVEEVIDGMIERGKLSTDLVPFAGCIGKIVSMAKQRAIGVLARIDDRDAYFDIIDHFDILDDAEDEADDDMLGAIVTACIQVLKVSNCMTDFIDFDDMVYLPLVHRVRFWQFDNVFVDEAQDTNPARRALVRALVKRGGRVAAVGDPCQPIGTLVSLPDNGNRWAAQPPRAVPIETIKVGDRVLSYSTADCTFLKAGRKVNGVTRRPYSGQLVIAESEGGISAYTPAHFCLVNLNGLREKFAVYLMRRGSQYRIGKCRMSYVGASGLSARMRDEGADATWLLATYDTEAEAYFREQAVAGRFGLPQLMFSAKKMLRGPSAEYLPEAWGFIGSNEDRADACLTYFRQDIRYPLFTSETGYLTAKRPIVARAACLIDGMMMLPYTGKAHITKAAWRPIKVRHQHHTGDVVSLDVEGTHIYVADGMVTRNCQAIYGFTGADADSLDLIQRDFNARLMPLTVSYRCPKAVVEFARQWVDHIEPAGAAPEGKVSTEPYETTLSRADLDAKSAILCRNTKPLVSMAFALIRRKVACKVEGRDIGAGLIKLATRWKRIKTLPALDAKLVDLLESERTKLLAKKQEAKLQEVEDRIDTLREIIDQCRQEGGTDVSAAVAFIEGVFADNVTGMLTLSTIHKSKGREWPRVFWLDRAGTCPSKYARQAWQLGQEDNLCYVAATRAQEELIEVTKQAAIAKAEKPASACA